MLDFKELDNLFSKKNSKGATQDLVNVLAILKDYGIDVKKIKRSDTLNTLLTKCRISNKKSEEICSKISEVTYEKDYSIGDRHAEQKRKRNVEKFKWLLCSILNDDGTHKFDKSDIEYLAPEIQLEKD